MSALTTKVISGSYTGTFNTNDIGLTEDGFRLLWSFEKEEITADSYGDSVIDSVYRGGQCFVEFNLKEYLAAAVAGMIWPYSATFGAMGVVGLLDVYGDDGTTFVPAKPLVLTDVTGTPAETHPATITFHQAVLDNQHQVEVALNNRHRVIPIRLRCYPTLQTAVVRWFTAT